MKNELELKHIVGYLPYRLKMILPKSGDIRTLTGIYVELSELRFHFGIINRGQTIWKYKPILRPMSDLTRDELKEQGYWHHLVDYLTYELQTELKEKGIEKAIEWIDNAPSGMVEFLRSRHYDVQFLIPRNLAVDVNSLEI